MNKMKKTKIKIIPEEDKKEDTIFYRLFEPSKVIFNPGEWRMIYGTVGA